MTRLKIRLGLNINVKLVFFFLFYCNVCPAGKHWGLFAHFIQTCYFGFLCHIFLIKNTLNSWLQDAGSSLNSKGSRVCAYTFCKMSVKSINPIMIHSDILNLNSCLKWSHRCKEQFNLFFLNSDSSDWFGPHGRCERLSVLWPAEGQKAPHNQTKVRINILHYSALKKSSCFYITTSIKKQTNTKSDLMVKWEENSSWFSKLYNNLKVHLSPKVFIGLSLTD